MMLIFFFYGCRFACSLLRQGMKQVIISSETPEVKSLEKVENKSAAAEVNLYSKLYILKSFVVVT